MNQSAPRSAWYRDNYRAPRRTSGQKKLRTGWIVGIIVLAVLALLVASARIFAHRAARVRVTSESGDGGFSFTFPMPGPEVSPFPGDDSIDDFFRQFDASVETLPESRIARVSPAGARALTLRSSAGRPALTLQELYAKCEPSIVGIEATADGSAGYYWGSGVILSADGCILTNQHLVADVDHATVILSDGTEYEAQLVGEDVLTDLAVLKIEAEGLRPPNSATAASSPSAIRSPRSEIRSARSSPARSRTASSPPSTATSP
jgi:S1-C subfamily serine protease